MTDYTQITDFGDKDALTGGDPEKTILGVDIDAELVAIAAAIASKLNSSGYTAADVLTKIKTVDGASSGLDADSVDAVGPFAVGVWTPSYTEEANLDSITANGDGIYARVGSVVIAAGNVAVDITAGGTNAAFNISIPVASNFSAANQLSGGLGLYSSSNPAYLVGSIESDATSNDARIVLRTDLTGSISINYVLVYRVI